MTTKIEQYNAAKREQSICQAWTALIGNKYDGGGGGIGQLSELQLAKVTVYHQSSDGANNYDIPAALAPYLCAAIKARFDELVSDALARQDAALKTAAAEALKEHGELLEAAGLSGNEVVE